MDLKERIIKLLAGSAPLRAEQIATLLGVRPQKVRSTLGYMRQRGEVDIKRDGYFIP